MVKAFWMLKRRLSKRKFESKAHQLVCLFCVKELNMKRIIAVVILAVMVAVLGFAGPAQAAEYTHYAYLTGYTYWDNTPPGTAAISHPVIHTQAARTGTFNDPITLAVGHSMASGNDVIDIAPGVKFYMVSLQKYFIVEDTCGDGPHPENGPCHTN